MPEQVLRHAGTVKQQNMFWHLPGRVLATCQNAFCHMSSHIRKVYVICPEFVLVMSKTRSGMCQFTF